jgi:hypothetical protein
MKYLNHLYLLTLKVVKVFLKSIKRIISFFLPKQRESTTKQQRTLEVLSSLSYRTGELKGYLQLVANSVSELLDLDWAVVTLCREGFERVLASSIDMGYDENYRADLHGTLTETVISHGRCLYVEDASIKATASRQTDISPIWELLYEYQLAKLLARFVRFIGSRASLQPTKCDW